MSFSPHSTGLYGKKASNIRPCDDPKMERITTRLTIKVVFILTDESWIFQKSSDLYFLNYFNDEFIWPTHIFIPQKNVINTYGISAFTLFSIFHKERKKGRIDDQIQLPSQ